MSGAVSELQRAIFDALRGDVALQALLGDRLFDQTPHKVPFPYLTFGRTSVYDWSTGTEIGTEQLITLHVWSKAKGKKEVLEIMDAAQSRLDDAALPLDGHHLVNLRLGYCEARYDAVLEMHHGLMRFRAVTEAAA